MFLPIFLLHFFVKTTAKVTKRLEIQLSYVNFLVYSPVLIFFIIALAYYKFLLWDVFVTTQPPAE
jgi:hypothetical protein